MPEVACRIHGQTMDKMKHFTKMHRAPRNQGPLFRSGQGSGGAPLLWLITWVAFSNALSSKMTGMSFCSPDHSNPPPFKSPTTQQRRIRRRYHRRCQRHTLIYTPITNRPSRTSSQTSPTLGSSSLRIRWSTWTSEMLLLPDRLEVDQR
jgi:hypothetical protein